MKITKYFEQKLLFNFGRHFFNIIAVAGFSTMLTGGLVVVRTSMTEKAKQPLQWYNSNDEKAKNAKLIVKSYAKYFDDNEGQKIRNKLINEFINFKGLINDGTLKSKNFSSCISGKNYEPNKVKLQGRQLGDFYFTPKAFTDQINTFINDPEDKANKKLINVVCKDFSKSDFKSKFDSNGGVQKVTNNFAGRIHSVKYTYARYDEYISEVEARNLIKLAGRLAGLIVLGSGAIVTAISSLISGVLSIERNTRKEASNS